MSQKHDAAKRLLQAARTMHSLLTLETDGTLLCDIARTSASNARVIELLTRPDTQDPEDDDEEDEEEDL